MDKKTESTGKKVVGWATLLIGIMMVLGLAMLDTIMGYRFVVGIVLALAGFFLIKK